MMGEAKGQRCLSDALRTFDEHRMVNAALAAELQGGVHALAIEARADDDASPRPAPVLPDAT